MLDQLSQSVFAPQLPPGPGQPSTRVIGNQDANQGGPRSDLAGGATMTITTLR